MSSREASMVGTVSRRRRRPDTSTLARRAFAGVEQSTRQLLRQLPSEQQLACVRGCDHCCAQRVSVTPLELFELVAHLRRTCDPRSLTALHERVRQTASKIRGTTSAQHRGTLCPLDEGGSCRAYDSRPLLCRGANSFDKAACAQAGAAIPTYAELSNAAQLVQERLDRECRRISGRAQMLELSCALLIALDEPEAEARWRVGEPVFEDAAHAWFEGGALHHWSSGDT